MNPHRVTLIDGAALLAVIASFTWTAFFSVLASLVAIVALAPLAYVRWKKLLNGQDPDAGKN